MSILGKISLWALFIAAVALAGVWIVGGKQKEYSTGLAINAQPAIVFYFLTNPDRHKSWASGLEEVAQYEPIVRTESGVQIVKTPRVVSNAGKQTRLEDQVIRYEQNQILTIESCSSSEVSISIFQLEPRDGQTHLTYKIKSNLKGLGRILGPLSKDETQMRIESELRKLKELVESATGLPPMTPAGNVAEPKSDLLPPVNPPGDVPTISF